MFMHRETRNIMIGVVAAAVVMWLADAYFDAAFPHEGTVRDLFSSRVPVHDIVFRSLFLVMILAGGYQYARIKRKRRISKDRLEKHLTAIETSMDGVAIFNDRHEYLYVNDAYARITGYRISEMMGKTFSLIYDARHVTWIEQNVFPALERTGRWHGELAACRKDGSVFEQEASITRLPDNSCVCVMRDATDRNRREEALQRSERLLNSIFASIHDPFCVFDENYRIVKVNKAYADLKNGTVKELIDKICYQVLEGKESPCDSCVITKTLQSGDPCAKEKKVTLRSGEMLWFEIFTYPIKDDQGKTVQVIEYTRDVTDRKKSEEDRNRLIGRLEYLSSVDGLTGLLNRRALTEQLTYEIERARRYKAPLSIMLCDMDNLKEINDRYGHLSGDTAIQLVSATLRNALRSVDIAGRYGGDEFLVILPETPIEGVCSIAEKVRETMQKTEIRIDQDKRVTLSVSIGIATLGASPEEIDGIISRVDSALYDSKNAGRNRISVAV